MKTINEYINKQQENQINESFLSVGLTIIVSLILAKFTFKGIAVVKQLFLAIKEAVLLTKDYAEAINELNELLEPYKDDLMKTEWGSKLFTNDGIINNNSIKSKGCSVIYFELEKDIKKTLSKDDYTKYKDIIMPIYTMERMKETYDFKN